MQRAFGAERGEVAKGAGEEGGELGTVHLSRGGVKTTAASSTEGNSRLSQTKIKRSAVRSLSLAGADRFRTTSCWRRNAVSASFRRAIR
jgi:hypothetical protein